MKSIRYFIGSAICFGFTIYMVSTHPLSYFNENSNALFAVALISFIGGWQLASAIYEMGKKKSEQKAEDMLKVLKELDKNENI